MLLHHTLGNGDFTVFANIFSKVTIAQTNLNDIHTAPGEIDRVLRECYLKARPVYIQLPTDMVEKECNASGLKSKLQLEDPTNNKDVEDYVVAKILDKLYAAKRPIILVDGCVPRHRVSQDGGSLRSVRQHLT